MSVSVSLGPTRGSFELEVQAGLAQSTLYEHGILALPM